MSKLIQSIVMFVLMSITVVAFAIPVKVTNNTHNDPQEGNNNICISVDGGPEQSIPPTGELVAVGDGKSFVAYLKCDHNYKITAEFAEDRIRFNPIKHTINGHDYYIQVKPYFIEPNKYVWLYVSEDGG